MIILITSYIKYNYLAFLIIYIKLEHFFSYLIIKLFYFHSKIYYIINIYTIIYILIIILNSSTTYFTWDESFLLESSSIDLFFILFSLNKVYSSRCYSRVIFFYQNIFMYDDLMLCFDINQNLSRVLVSKALKITI